MADRKYLAVYGRSATEVVGRIVEVWKNEERDSSGYGTLSITRPSRREGRWSRHLALQDMTGGLNYIGPAERKIDVGTRRSLDQHRSSGLP